MIQNEVMQDQPSEKKRAQKSGHLPPKIVISTPWEALCVDLVGPYTLKGKDGSSIDFMALTMIDPASSWFEVVELPAIMRERSKKRSWISHLIKSVDQLKKSGCVDTCDIAI